MQKKLIALAVAAMASGAAFAQSNVTIYGSVDMAASHRSDSWVRGVNSKTAIDSGVSAGNRLGFKGTEDLGNGLKAIFTLEAGFEVDTGEQSQDGRLFGRQAFVGLTGGFGTAIAGRLYTPHYSFLSTIDPFKAGTVGRYNNTYGADLNGLLDPIRVDNAVAYVSPSFSGFNVTAAYSNNAIDQENGGVSYNDNGSFKRDPITGRVTGVSGSGSNQNRVYAILPRYTNGPIDVAVNYHSIDMADSSGIDTIRNWLVGGTYDFGVAKLAAFYSDNKVDYRARGSNDLKVKNYMVGVTVPFGKHAVMASYNHSEAEQHRLDGDSDQWALGWTYDLSKRTNLYAAYASIDNDQTGRRNLFRNGSVGDATNGANNSYQEGFQFGVKHTF